MEDESVRRYVGRIFEIVVGITYLDGTKSKDEVIQKILKILTPPFKTVAQMIQLMIPYTTNFTKETLLGRLEATEFDLKQYGELTKVETTFSALNIKPGLTKNTKVQEDIASSSQSVEEKIQKGAALLVEREKDGQNIFKYWTCNEYGQYASKCPKRERKYKGRFRPRRTRNYLYANEKEEEEFDQRKSEDEL